MINVRFKVSPLHWYNVEDHISITNNNYISEIPLIEKVHLLYAGYFAADR